MAISLDVQAQALLQVIQSQKGTIAAQVEQQIEAAQTQSGKPKLDAEALAQVLLQAMPADQQLIQQARTVALKYHPDGTNSGFLTQILDLRIEKEENTLNVGARPDARPPARIDPLFAQFSMAPDAQFILLFNARDVDENGRPLLMKVVARESADLSKLDLTKYRTQPQNQPDIMKVKDDADFIDVQDQHETEFNFGDPLKAVSLNKGGDELSALVKVKPQNKLTTKNWEATWQNVNGTNVLVSNGRLLNNNVQTGDAIDRTPVAVFDKRVELTVGLAVDAWQAPTLQPADFTGKLNVARGLIFEPGASVGVSLFNTNVATKVEPNDSLLLGAPGASADVKLPGAMSLNQLLDSPLTITAQGNGNDRSQTSKTVRQVVYADAAKITFGGAAVNPAGSRPVARAGFAAAGLTITKDILKDEQRDGQIVKVDVAAGMLKNNGASIQGYKLAVGYMDPATNKWVELGAQTVDNDKESKAMSFKFDVPDSVKFNQANASIEVRAFTNTGFPAERLQVGYREVPWGSPPANG